MHINEFAAFSSKFLNVSASHILVLALQLFLSVNGWLREVSDLVKQIAYFSFIFGSGFVVVMINAFAYGDRAWGVNGMYETKKKKKKSIVCAVL